MRSEQKQKRRSKNGTEKLILAPCLCKPPAASYVEGFQAEENDNFLFVQLEQKLKTRPSARLIFELFISFLTSSAEGKK